MNNVNFSKIDFEALLKNPRKGPRRQIQIAQTAIQIIYEMGLEGFSFELLSQKCKVTRSLIYHYFPTLDDLILFSSAYIRFKYQQFVIENMQGKTDAAELLSAYVISALEWVDVAPTEASVWLIYFHRCSRIPALAEQNRTFVDIGYGRIQSLLRHGLSSQKFTISEEDIPEIARTIQILITGALISRATEKRSISHWKSEFENLRQMSLKLAQSLQI